MKKIILILALLSLGVSKAQVVGGYLPVNSTKSATMGGLRVNGNETVTGTFSVGSTATITGNVLLGGVNNLDNYNLNLVSVGSKDQQINFQRSGSTAWGVGRTNTNARFGISYSASGTPTLGSGDFFSITNLGAVGIGTITPTHTLEVVGNAKVSSTFSLGSAQLTGGNTGTVAVLSDAVFPVQFFPSIQSPADGTTYYIGQTLWDWTWTATTGRTYLPYNCTLVGATIVQRMSVVGTAESVTISVRANNTTDYTLTTTQTFSASPAETNITGLSHSFSANDAINIKVVCPTFATNPTNIYLGIVLWFVRRS